MTNEQFEQVYYPKYASVITAIARKIAGRNDALVEDLESEGMIALWKLDPAKAHNNPDAYIRQAIKFRMIDWMRRERPAQFESLTTFLEAGGQVVYDDDMNEARLILIHEPSRRLFLEDDASQAAYRLEHREEDGGEEE